MRMYLNKYERFLNYSILNKLYFNSKEIINFFVTHLYFYLIMFILQIIIILIYILMFFFQIINSVLIINILKIMYFIHGIVGIGVILDDYIFNKIIKIILKNIYYLLNFKIFILIFTIFC